MKSFFFTLGTLAVVLTTVVFLLSRGSPPERVTYGVTFSVPYAEEIGLEWKQVYTAMLDELKVRHLRIPVYWDRLEKVRGSYDWSDFDYQLHEAQKRDAKVILAIGRRVPRWPECHVPGWAKELAWDEQKGEVTSMLRAVVERYKDNEAVMTWQVENEPYLRMFADGTCGELDEEFFLHEVDLVRSLDSRPILVTDGGNFGTWIGAYRAGDVFGTSMYLYFWRPDTGAFRTILPAAYYRVKTRLVELLIGKKQTILSELSLEPWLAAHIEEVSIDEQISRMNLDKMHEIIDYARQSPFDTQYLWGVEWWYWMKQRGHSEFWEFAKSLYTSHAL